jgi:hypothetical protein
LASDAQSDARGKAPQSVELLRLANKESNTVAHQAIIDELYEMAAVAGIDPDEAQAIFAAAKDAPLDGVSGNNGYAAAGASPDEPSRVTAMDYAELLRTEFPPRETVLAPWLLSKGTAMIHGWRGLGKTLLTHGSAWAIATGGGFLKWKAKSPRRVLVIDGEMPMAALQERFRAIEDGSDLKPAPGYLRVAAADMFRNGLPDLADAKAQQFYADVVADADVIFADNLSTLCPHLKENDAEDYAPFQAWVLQQLLFWCTTMESRELSAALPKKRTSSIPRYRYDARPIIRLIRVRALRSTSRNLGVFTGQTLSRSRLAPHA